MSAAPAEGLVESDEEDAPLAMRSRQQPPPDAASGSGAAASPEEENDAAGTSETKALSLQEQVQRLQDRVDDLRAELHAERVASEQKDGIIADLRAEVSKLVRHLARLEETTAQI